MDRPRPLNDISGLFRKIALGTAQMGMDYGITNHRGRIPEGEVKEILTRANEYGIETLDTAMAYGDSEEVLGKLGDMIGKFQVVSKWSDTCSPLEGIRRSLAKLGIGKLKGYLVHHVEDIFKSPGLWDQFGEIKEKGYAEKTGVSLYNPEDLERLSKMGIHPDLVQVPYNVFDRRFESWFEKMRQGGMEIHVRSVFLQGTVFLQEDAVPPFLEGLKEKISRLKKLSAETRTSVQTICMGFALKNDLISRVVIGVDSMGNLEENLSAVSNLQEVGDFMKMLEDLREDREELINPARWSR